MIRKDEAPFAPTVSTPYVKASKIRAHILTIEDDPETAHDIVSEFEALGYAIDHFSTGLEGLASARLTPYDLIIIDRVLPDGDGLDIVSTLRGENIGAPVLLLSGLSDVNDRIRGLKVGGDDYMCKPFALSELSVRVEALLRRPSLVAGTHLQLGDLTLDLIGREARRGARRIELLNQEYKLLEYMMRRPGRVLSREMLLADIWHYRFQTKSNLVDVHIGRLRRKVDTGNDVPLIHTINGVGFMLCPQT